MTVVLTSQTDGIAAAIALGFVATLTGIHGIISPYESTGINLVNLVAGLAFICVGAVQIT
jgi:hypothetical protein